MKRIFPELAGVKCRLGNMVLNSRQKHGTVRTRHSGLRLEKPLRHVLGVSWDYSETRYSKRAKRAQEDALVPANAHNRLNYGGIPDWMLRRIV